MASRSYSPPEKSLVQLLSEFKEELKEFVATRIAMLRSEMSEKVSVARAALPAIIAGAALVLLAVVFFSVALVAVIASMIGGGPAAWAAGFTIIALFYFLTGAIAIAAAISKLKSRSLIPERTLRVLKQDQIWLQNEARNRS